LTIQAPVNFKAESPLPSSDIAGSAGTALHPAPLDREPGETAGRGEVLRVAGLAKSFRSGFLKRPIRGIEGVSFTVNRGAVFAILGHNGAGKTTTINCILDLVHPDAGEVSILGCNHRDCSSRARVGYLPERPYFFEHLTGRELLNFYYRLLSLPGKNMRARVDEVLALVGMEPFAGRRLRKFSKGMLQRIGLAQAVLGDPDLLILDEPMSGLDPIGRREVRDLLLDLKHQGKTIILSSHIVPDIEMIADTVGIMREGRLVRVEDLAGMTDGFSYTGHLAFDPGDWGGQDLPSWLPARHTRQQAGRVSVVVDNVDELRELLDNCHRHAVSVLAVDTRRSGLEDLFLAVNNDPDNHEGKTNR
jgi:ABC-2 type transport system ATP-binding protein